MDIHTFKVQDHAESIQSLLHELDRDILRSAMNGGITPEKRRAFIGKLDWIKDKLKAMPDRIE